MTFIAFQPKAKILERMSVSKPSKEETARIAILGDMDDRHKLYLAERNKDALIGLAIEYETLGRHGGLVRKAAEVRAEAEGMKE